MQYAFGSAYRQDFFLCLSWLKGNETRGDLCHALTPLLFSSAFYFGAAALVGLF